jgi:hypothetical protein
MQRMAAANAFDGQPTTFDEAVFFDGFITVMGAGGIKTTA